MGNCLSVLPVHKTNVNDVSRGIAPPINLPSQLSGAAALVRTAGRNAEITRFEQQVVKFFVDAAEMFGVPKSVAAIYAMYFASPEPLSFVDVSSRLAISQGSISQGLRVLREMGALKVVGTRDRRDYFSPDLELRRVAACFIEERLQPQLDGSMERLRSLKEYLPKDERAVRVLRARLQNLDAWNEKSRALLPVIMSVLKLGEP